MSYIILMKQKEPVTKKKPGAVGELIDLREVKKKAAEILPPGHPVLVLLAGEPDFLPFEIGCAKLHYYARLVLAMRGKM